MAGAESEARSSISFHPEYSITPETDIQHKCGLVTIRTEQPTRQFAALIEAAYGVQHRGQLGWGIAMHVDGAYMSHTGDGLLRYGYTQEVIDRFSPIETKLGFKQLRYGTEGGYGSDNLQPFHATHEATGVKIVVNHNGQFTDVRGMREGLERLGYHFQEGVSDTRLFTQLLATSDAATPDEAVLSTLDTVDGAYNLTIGIDDTLYVARDLRGTHPLELGVINFPNTQGWIVASETHAFSRIGKDTDGVSAEVIRRIKPGEVLKIDDNGVHQLREGEVGEGHPCEFEWIYFMHPSSRSPQYKNPDDGEHPERWASVFAVREQAGKELAKISKVENGTVVVGMPDSAIDIGLGYAFEAGIPYRQIIKRDHYGLSGGLRTFLHDNDDDQEIRRKVFNKLIFPEGNEAEGEVIVIVDDSAVRGNVSRVVTEQFYALGASEVHWRFVFPPVRYPCPLGISFRENEKERLVADGRTSNAEIAEAIGAKSVDYGSPETLLRATKGRREIILPEDPSKIFLENGGCGGCVTGRYPIDSDGVIWQNPEKVKEPEFIHK